MKAGDIVIWKAVNRLVRATIRDDGGELVAVLKSGKTFPLKDIERSKSLMKI